jgi:hypothetical protein
VPKHFATIGHATQETISAINKDHQGICRFSSNEDDGYQVFLGTIDSYMSRAFGMISVS